MISIENITVYDFVKWLARAAGDFGYYLYDGIDTVYENHNDYDWPFEHRGFIANPNPSPENNYQSARIFKKILDWENSLSGHNEDLSYRIDLYKVHPMAITIDEDGAWMIHDLFINGNFLTSARYDQDEKMIEPPQNVSYLVNEIDTSRALSFQITKQGGNIEILPKAHDEGGLPDLIELLDAMVDEWPENYDRILSIIDNEEKYFELINTDAKEDIPIFPGKRGPKNQSRVNYRAIEAWESAKKRGKTFDEFSEEYFGYYPDGALKVKKSNFYTQRLRLLRENSKKIKSKVD